MTIYELIGTVAVTVGLMSLPVYCYRAFSEDWNIFAKCGLALGVILEVVILFVTVVENAENKRKNKSK